MTSRTTEQDTLDAWDVEWSESDERAHEMVERFKRMLGERDDGLTAELQATEGGTLERDPSWMKDPTGESAATLFQTLYDATRNEDLTFTDRAVLREEVVDVITQGIRAAVEESGSERGWDLLNNGKRMMVRGATTGADEVFYRGVADVRAAQKRTESDGGNASDDGTVNGAGENV